MKGGERLDIQVEHTSRIITLSVEEAYQLEKELGYLMDYDEKSEIINALYMLLPIKEG